MSPNSSEMATGHGTAEAAPPALRAEGDAAFLDIDGTLAPLRPHPDDVRFSGEETRTLDRVRQALGGALALVSGRGLDDIDRILGAPGFAAAGVHGLERRDARGRLDRAQPHPALARASATLREIAAEDPGLLVEDKGLGVTLHYRRAPRFEGRAIAAARRLADETGLAFQGGDCIVELRTPGRDKGEAVRAFMAQAPFLGRAPVFVGDDLTDEHGFEAAAAMGGYGVLVGARVSRAARWRLADPDAVWAWLARALDGGVSGQGG